MNKYYLCIDLGGTTCKFGLFNDKNKLLSKWYIDTKLNDKHNKDLFSNIIISIKVNLLKLEINTKDLKAISMAVPGIVKDNHIIKKLVNIDLNRSIDIEKLFKKEFGKHIRVIAENDANVAALGEYKFGLGKNKNPFCHIIIGTGIGLGIIVDGKILSGFNNTAGEFGHLVVDKYYNIKCNCGEIGCLETVASGTGIVNLYYKMSKTNKRPLLKNKLSAKDIINKVKQNDEFSKEVFDKSMSYLAIAIDYLIKIINPELISIGGGVSEAGKIILKYLNKNLDKYKSSSLIKKPKIVISKLKNDAGIYGALALVI